MARLLLRSNFRGFFASQFRMLSDQVLVYRVLDLAKIDNPEEVLREQKEQLYALRKYHEEEIDHSKKEIECLQREIACHKGNIKKLKHDD